MGERVRIVRHQGRLLAAKGVGAKGIEALEEEAELLRRAQVPGVVELVGLLDGDEPALLTRWVGARSLADVAVPVPPERAAAVILAVAATVARLHRAGIVHGALDPSHVLLDPDGRPVLCGFGSAGPIGAPVRRPATDPGRNDEAGDTTLRPAIDVDGLGRLLDHQLGPSTAGPGRWRRGRSARALANRRRTLTGLVAQATAADPAARPSVPAFAHVVRRAVPGARLAAVDRALRPSTSRRPRASATAASGATGTAERNHRPGDRPPPRRRVRGAGSAVASALALTAIGLATYAGLSAWWAPSGERAVVAPASGSRPSPDAPPASPASPAAAPTSTTAVTRVPTPPPPDGPTIEHAGHTYRIGRAGDVVVLGPWRCDGRDLPAVLHPADGSVHVFDDWPRDGTSTTARAVVTVPGATGLRPVVDPADPSRCPQLLVVDDDRALTTLSSEDLR